MWKGICFFVVLRAFGFKEYTFTERQCVAITRISVLFTDHAHGCFWLHNQLSLSAVFFLKHF